MGVGRWIRLVSSLLYDASIGIWARDLRRLDHLRQGHVIGVVSPLAAARYRRHLRLLGGSRLAERVRLIPHPVVPHFRWDAGGGKRPAVAAVGRWDARWQKRPDLLCSVIAQFAAAHAEAGFHVVGEPTREMNEWRAALPGAIRERVIFHGRLPNEALVPVYQQARILLVPSLFESFHIAAGEALCCGCSVVGLRRPSLPSLEWFAEHDGTLAAKETADGLTAAVGAEWENWNRGDRDPQLISRRWSERLHAPEVARRIHELARGAR
jgi:glycosyltransferase involved in cell wall biosynthesis